MYERNQGHTEAFEIHSGWGWFWHNQLFIINNISPQNPFRRVQWNQDFKVCLDLQYIEVMEKIYDICKVQRKNASGT